MIKIGGSGIADIRIGANAIKEAYVGGDLIWKKRPRFIIAGGNLLSYSNDATTWRTIQISGQNYSANGIAFGNGMFALSGEMNRSYYSKNLESWSCITHPSGGISYDLCKHVAFGNGKFVLAGHDGENKLRCAISEDAISWTDLSIDQSLPDPESFSFGNGKFVYLNYSKQRLYESQDCVSWTQKNVERVGFVITFTGGLFLMLGLKGKISYEESGVWKNATIDDADFTAICACYANGSFFAFGRVPDGSQYGYVWKIATSNDAKNWKFSLTPILTGVRAVSVRRIKNLNPILYEFWFI